LDRCIIFVAHSLGGLIVKDVCISIRLVTKIPRLIYDRAKALNHSESVRDTKPHLSDIFTATRGIIFLGTPHRGSGVASLTKVVAAIARLALRSTNDNLIGDIERDAPVLDRIRDGFSRLLDKRTLTVWSFTEELASAGFGKVNVLYLLTLASHLTSGDQVVSGDSAIIGDARENRETIHADHVGMTKFSSREDSEYKKILCAIEMLLQAPIQEHRTPGDEGM
jgi:hypothetical protein